MNLSIAKERLAAVVKPDSVTASQGDFLATHVEIKKLVLLNKFEFVPDSQKYTSEENIYKSLLLTLPIDINLLLCTVKVELVNHI